jgi:predicted rRNA methylase YqxC with S4 and FtsJ domains
MNLYDILKKRNLVKDRKDFVELIWGRSIRVNGYLIDDPKHVIDIDKDNTFITIGVSNEVLELNSD